MKALLFESIPRKYFLTPTATEAYLAGAQSDFIVENTGKYICIHGTFERLVDLCEKTGGPGKVFFFQDVENDISGMCHIVAKSGMSMEEVMEAIETA